MNKFATNFWWFFFSLSLSFLKLGSGLCINGKNTLHTHTHTYWVHYLRMRICGKFNSLACSIFPTFIVVVIVIIVIGNKRYVSPLYESMFCVCVCASIMNVQMRNVKRKSFSRAPIENAIDRKIKRRKRDNRNFTVNVIRSYTNIHWKAKGKKRICATKWTSTSTTTAYNNKNCMPKWKRQR